MKKFYRLFLMAGFFLFIFSGCEDDRFKPPPSKKKPVRGEYFRKLQAPPPVKSSSGGKSPRTKGKDFSITILKNYGHSGPITSIISLAGGRWLITASLDRTVIAWRMPEGKVSKAWYLSSRRVRRLRPSPDGRRFLVLTDDGKFSLWSPEKGPVTHYSSDSPVADAHFSPLGFKIWALTEKGKLLEFSLSAEGGTSPLFTCPSGGGRRLVPMGGEELLVLCGDNRLYRISRKGRELSAELPIKARELFYLEGKKVALISGDTGKLCRLRIGSGEKNPLCRRGHLRAITGIAVLSDTSEFFTASLDTRVARWKLSELRLKEIFKLQGPRYTALGAVSDELLAVGTEEGEILLLNGKGKVKTRLRSVPTRGRILSFAPQTPYLVSSSGRGKLLIWDLHRMVGKFKFHVHPFPVLFADFAADRNHFLSVDQVNAAFWDLRESRLIAVVYPPKKGRITAATEGRDWTRVFFGTARAGVYLWTIAGPQMIYRDIKPQCVTAVALNGRINRAAAGTCSGELFLYDFLNYRFLKKVKLTATPIEKILLLDQNSGVILVGEGLYFVSLPGLEVRSKIIGRFGALYRDGDRFLLAKGGELFQLRRPYRKLEPLVRACDTGLRAVSRHPGKGLLATFCDDGIIKIWRELGSSFRVVSMLFPFPDGNWAVISPEGGFATSLREQSFLSIGVFGKFYTDFSKLLPLLGSPSSLLPPPPKLEKSPRTE